MKTNPIELIQKFAQFKSQIKGKDPKSLLNLLLQSGQVSQKDNELQSAQLALANGVQTQNILNAQGRYVPYAGCGSCCNGNVFSGFNGNVW